MFRMQPRPRATMPGCTCRLQVNSPRRLTSMACQHSPGSTSHSGPTGPLTPALLTGASTGPELVAKLRQGTRGGVPVRDVGDSCGDGAAASKDGFLGLRQGAAARPMRPTDAPAPASASARWGAPETVAPAGHHSDHAGQWRHLAGRAGRLTSQGWAWPRGRWAPRSRRRTGARLIPPVSLGIRVATPRSDWPLKNPRPGPVMPS
jgi:hypothetical protein